MCASVRMTHIEGGYWKLYLSGEHIGWIYYPGVGFDDLRTHYLRGQFLTGVYEDQFLICGSFLEDDEGAFLERSLRRSGESKARMRYRMAEMMVRHHLNRLASMGAS